MRKKINKENTPTDLLQIDGKFTINNITSLEQILGDTGISKYGTLNYDEYKNKIDEMLIVDLQSEALRIGLIPNVEPKELKARLLREFQRHINQFRISESKLGKNISGEFSKEALKILREGA